MTTDTRKTVHHHRNTLTTLRVPKRRRNRTRPAASGLFTAIIPRRPSALLTAQELRREVLAILG